MKQASLKLKMGFETVNAVADDALLRKNVLNVMIFVFFALVLSYVLILGNMVFDIAQRKVLEKEALALVNEVGSLELSYLSISNSLDLSLSESMGFKETKATFATRKSLGSLSLLNNEI